MSAEAIPSYPATFTFDPPESIARWRVIGNVILAIPHLVWVALFGFAAFTLAFVMWLAVLFERRAPRSLHAFLANFTRYAVHLTA